MPYIYQAALWCDDCGREISERLTSEGKAPEDPSDEHTYDSDDFPKYVYEIGASDSADHCDAGPDCLNAEDLGLRKIGAWLENDLTSDGVEWVKSIVANQSSYGSFLREAYAWIDFPSDTSDES